MENLLQDINRNFVSLPEKEVARNKSILESVVQILTDEMRNKDLLFDGMFKGVFYGGSFYDGLRVGKPEEFDLDFLFHIPVFSGPKLTECDDAPGFLQLKINELDKWLKQPEAKPKYEQFRKKFLDDEDFLSTVKVQRWMISIVDKCLNGFQYELIENDAGPIHISRAEGGPAVTLHVSVGSEFKMDIDLVPCFVFGGNQWPSRYYRSNPVPLTRPRFFIVPKQPKPYGYFHEPQRYWRPSFQEQERELIEKKERLKPALRLIKKMRDVLDHKLIASYYIKTVFLHLVDKYKDEPTFWDKSSLSEVFMKTLEDYEEYIRKKEIPYYWNSKNNLIGRIDIVTLEDFANRLRNVIKDIKNNPDEPQRITKYLMSKEEHERFTNPSRGAVLLVYAEDLEGHETFMNRASDKTKERKNDPCKWVVASSEPGRSAKYLEKEETNDTMKWVVGGVLGAAAAAGIGYLIYSAVSNRPRNDRTNERR